MPKVLMCAGYGQLNSRVAERWINTGGEVIALRQSQASNEGGVPQIKIDLARETWPDKQADVVVMALSASERTEQAYRAAYVEPLLQLEKSLSQWQRLPEKVIIVSSTRVYGWDDGREITDETTPETDDAYGQILLEMERVAARLTTEPTTTTVVRLSGIYAPNRNWLKRMALKTTDESLEKNHWTNRIHIDDAADAIVFLLQQKQLENSYIISDCQPVPVLEMYNYFRQKAGVDLLETKLAATRGKRVIPSRLKTLGFQWQYPNAFSGGYEGEGDLTCET